MKIWKTVAQNVLSGCAGGMLVMCAAQAQKSAAPAQSTVPAQREIRTHKLVIVDENNKEVGLFLGFAGNADFTLTSGRSYVHLSASDLAGTSMTLGRQSKKVPNENRRLEAFVVIDVNDHESAVRTKSGNYGAELTATEDQAVVFLSNSKMGTKQNITASVDKYLSDISAFGPTSSMCVGDENARERGALNWGIYPSSASLDLRDNSGHTFWSQPSLSPTDLLKASPQRP